MTNAQKLDYSLGLIKIDGLTPSGEFLELVEREKRGEITAENMKIYIWNETNEIEEELYCGEESGFCVVEKYDYKYKKELPRFKKIDFKAYGLPYNDVPEKVYLGIGNSPQIDGRPPKWYRKTDSLPQCENEAIKIREKIFSSVNCDLVWVRIHGSANPTPGGYQFYGYDVTYPPRNRGAFSIINDCMFICTWHGCDAEGTAFADYFDQLNENGLFDEADMALRYMKYYLNFDWSERDDYVLCEIFRKNQ